MTRIGGPIGRLVQVGATRGYTRRIANHVSKGDPP
ncbi:MAG: hypothetical protein ACYDHU_11315 [Acidimicrobiales bacterium]